MKDFPLEGVIAQFGFLEGKILTIIDAAFSDGTQRKAVKDLARNAFRDQMNHMEAISNTPEFPDAPRAATSILTTV